MISGCDEIKNKNELNHSQSEGAVGGAVGGESVQELKCLRRFTSVCNNIIYNTHLRKISHIFLGVRYVCVITTICAAEKIVIC